MVFSVIAQVESQSCLLERDEKARSLELVHNHVGLLKEQGAIQVGALVTPQNVTLGSGGELATSGNGDGADPAQADKADTREFATRDTGYDTVG